MASDPGAYKWDPLPLRCRLCEPQEIKHPGLIEDNSANDESESSLAEELLSLRHSFRAKELMTRENTFNDGAWR
jgi:hypothetical protein